MTTTARKAPVNIDCLQNLRADRYDWNIKVRIIRKWQNTTQKGTLVQGINVLLLDDKNITMQAFVAGTAFDKYKDFLTEGDIFLISNFSVKDVLSDQTHLLTTNNRSILFTKYTSVEEAEDNDNLILDNTFDFYDIRDIEEMLNQTKFLSDVIGVVEDYQPIRRWTSKTNKEIQKAIIKFMLSDTSGSIRVILWDQFAEKFQSLMDAATETPCIAILAAARVVKSEDSLAIGTVNATHLYVNTDHHSVQQLRKMLLTNPNFTQPQQSQRRCVNYPVFTITEIGQRGRDKIGSKVILLLTIRKLLAATPWFFFECTSCREELFQLEPNYKCDLCHRDVTYADRKFQLGTICSDLTGMISLIISDTDLRYIMRKTVFDLTPHVCKGNEQFIYPEEITNLINMDIRALVQLTKEHVVEGCNVFHASQVILGHTDSELGQPSTSKQSMVSQLHSNYGEVSTSGTEYHLDTISQIKDDTPMSKKPIPTKKRTKKATPTT